MEKETLESLVRKLRRIGNIFLRIRKSTERKGKTTQFVDYSGRSLEFPLESGDKYKRAKNRFLDSAGNHAVLLGTIVQLYDIGKEDFEHNDTANAALYAKELKQYLSLLGRNESFSRTEFYENNGDDNNEIQRIRDLSDKYKALGYISPVSAYIDLVEKKVESRGLLLSDAKSN